MATRVAWSDEENSILVHAYLEMLRSELKDEIFVKADVNRQLQGLLDRGRGSIEFKLMNVSAVLRELSFPFVNGYKPYPNIQASLRDCVREEILRRQDLTDLAFDSMTASMPDVADSATWKQGEPPALGLQPSDGLPGQRAGRWNFVELEAMNRRLGAAGERAVLARERVLLTKAGQHHLASRVDHVSQTVGDGLGFDIRSFEPDGTEKLIEVKTTKRGAHWPMVVSRNEVEVSGVEGERYHLYRLHDFRPEAVRFYTLRGDLRTACDLAPESYTALPSRSSE
ncbi:DUF3883 domain-containing protein [Janibacter limosus]|uniref:DUF3883 domain-containing protein n=1 Tax=Janibacter limosus TaxID=53458 RepID=UPI00082D4E7C|nr:DUF3883 domain-containing protein [Janibacter limosus]